MILALLVWQAFVISNINNNQCSYINICGFLYAQEVISAKYSISKSSLRIYVHYLPSYYHLHVHFTHISYDAPGIVAGKAHLLDDIIDNLELLANFYQQKTMTYVLRESDELFKRFSDSRNLSGI